MDVEGVAVVHERNQKFQVCADCAAGKNNRIVDVTDTECSLSDIPENVD